MDTSDPEIEFDENGVCHHVADYRSRVENEVFKGARGRQLLGAHIAQIKDQGRGKNYDCILGLSGGVDSTYVAYISKKYELRPLAVHLDNGWNSETAVRNIENIVKILDLDLYTEVLDWEEFRSLQLAFLRASTPDSEIPTDHAIVATLYKTAAQNRVKWIMDGSNVVTEIMVPATWSHGHSDWGYIKGLNDRFGTRPLKTYPHYTYYGLRWYREVLGIQRFPILNFLEFNKLEAMKVLERELGWTPYGGKHYESIYTRFYQGHILPQKFGFDKRRSHLSCLVLDGRITRDQALADMQQPALDEEQEREDRDFVVKKLGISHDEFNEIMNAERHTFWDYPSDERDLSKTLTYKLFWAAGTTAMRAKHALAPAASLPRVAVREVANYMASLPKYARRKPWKIVTEPIRWAIMIVLGVVAVLASIFLPVATATAKRLLQRILPEATYEQVRVSARNTYVELRDFAKRMQSGGAA